MSKTILITGTSSGFGRDTAETLRRAGHTVYASMRGAEGKNREAAEALRKLGIKTVELDVSDDSVCRSRRQDSAGRGRQDRCARQQRRYRLGRRHRSLHHGTGEGDLRHECHRAASRHPRRAPLHATAARWPDHQHRLDPRPRDVPLPRHLRREQVRGRSADRQPPLRSLAARRRGRGGAAERIPDQLLHQPSDAPQASRSPSPMARSVTSPTPWSRP